MYTVNFKFEQRNTAPVVVKHAAPGQSILELALNNNIEMRHDCGGICACTSCHVFIKKGMQYIDELGKREADFMERVINTCADSRLGCQSLLLDGEGEIEVVVPGTSSFSEIRKNR